jgi:hypothetical protein
MTYKNITAFSATLILILPLALFAENKGPESLPIEKAYSPMQLKVITIDSLLSKNNPQFIDADSAYKIFETDAYFKNAHEVINSSKNPTETIALLNKLKMNLEQINRDHPQTASILKQLHDYKPKLLAIIQKEKQLDELLDYITRLKKVASTRKDSPVAHQSNCSQTKGSSYQWPKCS